MDFAGVVLSRDSMHIQFNERDFFSKAEKNGLNVSLKSDKKSDLNQVRLVDQGSFDKELILVNHKSGFYLDFNGHFVSKNHFIRLEWINPKAF